MEMKKTKIIIAVVGIYIYIIYILTKERGEVNQRSQVNKN